MKQEEEHDRGKLVIGIEGEIRGSLKCRNYLAHSMIELKWKVQEIKENTGKVSSKMIIIMK